MTTTAIAPDTAGATVGIQELRNNLGQHIDAAYHAGRVTTVSRHGRRVAVIISAERYDQLTAAHDPVLALG